jgi:hypothetical protein
VAIVPSERRRLGGINPRIVQLDGHDRSDLRKRGESGNFLEEITVTLMLKHASLGENCRQPHNRFSKTVIWSLQRPPENKKGQLSG